jgi:hypothetical protein
MSLHVAVICYHYWGLNNLDRYSEFMVQKILELKRAEQLGAIA